MSANIQKIEIVPIQIKLNEPFVISKGKLTHAQLTVVKIYTKKGYGIGECSPYQTIHGETQGGTLAAAKLIAENLIGHDVTQIHKAVQIMDAVLANNSAIKSAFDMALYDLNAKMVNLPLYKYLNGSNTKSIYTDMTVSLLDKNKMVEKAVQFADRKFPILKVKLGERPSVKDVERIKAIRQAVGMEIPIRIDANQGWNYFEALFALNRLSEYNIQHCEAPISATDFIGLSRLNNVSPISIMGDESVFTHHDAFRMLSHHCIELINIKLGKSGGICNAMKVASIAEAADVNCQVGSFSESRLGITALVHFSTVWKNIIHYDLDSPLMYSSDPVIGGMKYHADWSVTIDDDPGIGADYDPVFLNKFDKIVIK